MCTALEELVRKPSGKEHSEGSTDNFCSCKQAAGLCYLKAFNLCQKRCTPVKNGQSDDIYTEIGNRYDPDIWVSIYHPVNDLSVLCLAELRDWIRFIVFYLHCSLTHLLHRRKAYFCRVILESVPKERNSEQSDQGRHNEAQIPCAVTEMLKQVTAERDNQTGTEGMRHIPYRLFCRQFGRLDPVSKKADTRRHAHSLKIAVKHPERTDKVDKSHCGLSFSIQKIEHSVKLRAETYDEIHGTSQQKAQCHDLLLAVAVYKHSIDETRKAINDTVGCKEDSKLNF